MIGWFGGGGGAKPTHFTTTTNGRNQCVPPETATKKHVKQICSFH